MLPSSRPHQHVQRTQFPSIIRTRSQQQHPLAPVDMYASPFKEAIRNNHHNHNRNRHTVGNSTQAHKMPSMTFPDVEPQVNDTEDRVFSHKRRATSPSFAKSDHPGKRTRILGQSSKVNSLASRHPEESPFKDMAPTTPVKASPSTWAISRISPGMGLTHVDLSKISSSPSKIPNSPARTFKIMTDDGYTHRVPVTPSRRPAPGEDEIHKSGVRTSAPLGDAEHDRGIHSCPRSSTPPAVLRQPSTPVLLPNFISPYHDGITSSIPRMKDDITRQDSPRKHLAPSASTHTQFQTTPVRSEMLGRDLLSRCSPLTSSPTITRSPGIPCGTSGFINPARPNIWPSIFSDSVVGPTQGSPTKSRIPVPSNVSLSRHPRQSLSMSTLPVADLSSPVRPPARQSPIKSKHRTKGRAKSGVRSRVHLTRLAAKRGLRKTSPTGLRPGPSSVVKCNESTHSSELVGPSNAIAAASVQSRTGRDFGKIPPCASSGSPKKPTPLIALSTALQKLQAIPPAAPLPRPRPNTSLGFAGVSLIPTHVLSSTEQGDTNTGTSAHGGDASCGRAGLQRSNTSLGHSDNTLSSLGKMGLPLRRPTSANGSKWSTTLVGAPFASKQTTLSTVQASPAPSAAPRERNTLSITRDVKAEVIDVDDLSPSDRNDEGNERIRDEINHTEYFVPLANEPHTKRQPSPELVSPSRRASQASLSLIQSLSLPRPPAVRVPARSASASTSLRLNPRTPVKTRGKSRPPPQPAQEQTATTKDDPMYGKRSDARMPGSLDVLRECIIFVDVRTEEGEDAAALFVDMLRGLGARILTKPGKSCTHLVYKAGLPSTITRYLLLPEPRPLAVSIGWVVECVEKRAHVDETRFLVNLHEVGVAGGVQRRRSMQPKQMRTLSLGQLDSGEPADISVRADSSFTSEEPSTSGLFSANSPPSAPSADNNLPPLERARQRSLRLPRE